MEKNNEEMFKEIIANIEKLPPENQKAVAFIIENHDLIKKMCAKNDMPEEEIQKRLIQAKETNDYILLALLTAAQVFSLHRES